MITRLTIIYLVTPAVLRGSSRKSVLNSVKAMEAKFSVRAVPQLVSGHPVHTKILDRGPSNPASNQEYYAKHIALSPDWATRLVLGARSSRSRSSCTVPYD